MCFAELGAFDGVVFAGMASGNGGGAYCHNGDCTRPGVGKKEQSGRGQVAGGGTATILFCRITTG